MAPTYRWPLLVASLKTTSTAADDYMHGEPANDSTWVTTENQREVIWPIAATLRDLEVQWATGPGGVVTRALRPMKNGVAAALSAVVTGAGTQAWDLAPADKVTFAAADRFSWNKHASTTDVVSLPNRWRACYESATQALFGGTQAATATTAGSQFAALADAGGLAATASEFCVFPVAGTLQNFYARTSAAIAATFGGTLKMTIVKDVTTDSAVVFTWVNGDQAKSDVSHTISVAAGDRYYIRFDVTLPNTGGTSTINAVRVAWGMEFVASTPGVGVHFASTGNNQPSNAADRFIWQGSAVWDATEANAQAFASGLVVTDLRARRSTSAVSGTQTSTIDLRQNGGSTAASVALTSGGNAQEGAWNGAVKLNADDLVCVRHHPTNTPTATAVFVGIAFRAPLLTGGLPG